jgi:hypothetical protein
MSNPFQDHLTGQLAAALRSGAAVVVDAEHAFEPLIHELTGAVEWSDEHPATAVLQLDGQPVRFCRFEGSWFGVKHAVEPFLSRDGPPQQPLLVYVPRPLPKPTQNVLTELMLAGKKLEWDFDREARSCLRKKFTDGVIDEVLAGGRATYEDVVAFLSQSSGTASKLKALYPRKTDSDILLHWLVDAEEDRRIADKQAESELGKLVSSRLGLETDGAVALSTLRVKTARLILVAEFLYDLEVETPPSLARVPQPGSDEQRGEALELARRFRDQHPDAYVARADQVEQELRLATTGLDPASLGRIDTFRFEEQLLLSHCVELLTDGKYAEALDVATARSTSFWVAREVGRKAQWELCRLVGELGLRVEAVRKDLPPSSAGPEAWVRGYAAEGGWHTVDGAQRALETFRTQMRDDPACATAVAKVLQRHEKLLHKMAERYSKALAGAGWTVPEVLPQTRIHSDVVEHSGGRVAYFWVDAMRFEMGAELARKLSGVEDLHLQPAVASLPSITPVGMAALMPGASTNFSVDAKGGKLVSVVDDKAVATAKDREKHVKARIPDSTFIKLNEVLLWPPSRVKKRVEGKSLLIVNSQGIDLYGEAGDDLGARRAMANVIGDIERAVRQLAAHGVEHFVITADHGHLFGLRKGDDMKTDAPGGDTVDLHRRCWIGRGGATPPGTQRVTAAELGYRSNLEFVFPTGMGVIKAGGDLSFHHGSTSLQEMVVPVLSFRLAVEDDAAGPSGVHVELANLPTSVTNMLFQVRVKVTATDLFSREPLEMRVVLLHGQEQVGQAGMADISDFDRQTGVLRLEPGKDATLVMRLTRDDVENLRVVVLAPESSATLAQSSVLPVRLMR